MYNTSADYHDHELSSYLALGNKTYKTWTFCKQIFPVQMGKI